MIAPKCESSLLCPGLWRTKVHLDEYLGANIGSSIHLARFCVYKSARAFRYGPHHIQPHPSNLLRREDFTIQ